MLDANQAKEDIREILEGKEYTAYYDPPSRSILDIFWEKVMEWLVEILAKLFPNLESTNALATSILIAIIIIVLLILAGVIIWVVRKSRKKQVLGNHNPLKLLKEEEWSYNMHLIEAEKREELEEYNLSVRHLFLALLLYFHKKEWLIAKVWKTNWEYYDELSKVNQEFAEQFFDLALLFDEVTYGERSIEKEEYIRYKSIVVKLIEEDNDSTQYTMNK